MKTPLIALLVLLFAAARGGAQDRMPPIPSDKLTEAQKEAVAEFEAARSVDISGQGSSTRSASPATTRCS